MLFRSVAKVDELHFDAVLHDSHDEDYLHLAPSRYPMPVAGLALAARTHNDENRLADVLQPHVDIALSDAAVAYRRGISRQDTLQRVHAAIAQGAQAVKLGRQIWATGPEVTKARKAQEKAAEKEKNQDARKSKKTPEYFTAKAAAAKASQPK